MKITSRTKIYGVIGNPITHSLSPIVHNYWFDRYHIDGAYVAFTAERENFDETVRGLFSAGIRGINVTAPFKEQAFQFSKIKTDEAQNAGAVNTLYVNKDQRIVGTNTDGLGFFHSLQANTVVKSTHFSVLLIGAGGAARGLIATYLQQFPGKLYLYNRTYENALSLRALFSPELALRIIPVQQIFDAPLSEISLVVNTVKQIETTGLLQVAHFLEKITDKTIIYDINYGYENIFLQSAKARGLQVFDGLPMLVYQAAYAFEKFTGIFPELDEKFFSFINSKEDSAKL